MLQDRSLTELYVSIIPYACNCNHKHNNEYKRLKLIRNSFCFLPVDYNLLEIPLILHLDQKLLVYRSKTLWYFTMTLKCLLLLFSCRVNELLLYGLHK